MRIEYINPFLEASEEILKEVLGENTKIEREELYLKETTSAILGVAVFIGITGGVLGRVLIDMEKSTALNIASVMMGEPVTEFDEMAKSSINELANMIAGSAITKLDNIGFSFQMSPPSIFTGENMSVSSMNLEAFIVPLATEYGKIEINVAVKEKDES